MAYVCSHCGKPNAGRQFGTWVGYRPGGYDTVNDSPSYVVQDAAAWLAPGEVAVTKDQMDIISNPNQDSECCDSPLRKM